MAKTSSKQQSSQLKKLLLVGAGLVVIIFVAFPSGSPPPTGPKTPPVFGAPSSSKKTNSLITDEDRKAKFEPIGATIKNGFVPLVVKGGGNSKLSSNGLPPTFTEGGTWTYTGNMVVDGTPNALLENGSNGEGVFLRPGQHWKNLRLVSVKEDSIIVEGPNQEMKTIYFDDKSLNSAASAGAALQPLPPAAIQGNLPQGANPQLNQRSGRRQRGQQADQANTDAMSGSIGDGSDLQSSIEGSADNTNYTGKNRRIKGNQ
jgi:hypothetical protein